MEKDKKPCPDSLDPYSSSLAVSSTSNSLPDSNGWQKPTKVAHRRSPNFSSRDGAGDVAMVGARFSTLGQLNDAMELGLDDDQGLRDAFMADPSVMSLKRSQSPQMWCRLLP